ncbi:hypothetical protein [Actinomycetospora aeridis]|uniref:Uncharacterized protein n=1 Tax=Actinomycetospora aeridis TaxID=3129231 RepID=A0ABU8N6X5_9PSEU
MVGGSGAGGESFYDAASGTHHGVGSPEEGRRRAEVAGQLDGEAGRARLWFALVLLALLMVIGAIAVL